MIQQKRVTPEMAKKAYKDSGLKPITFTVLDERKGCGCLIGAIGKCNGVELVGGLSNPFYDYMEDNYGTDYTWGLVYAFDGRTKEEINYDNETEEFKLGYDDGVVCRQAVFK